MHFFQTMTLFDPPLLPTPSLGVGIDCNCIPFMNLSGGAGILSFLGVGGVGGRSNVYGQK